MASISLLSDYFSWHYTRGIADLLRVLGNFLWFIWNYFSIKQLTKTFFVPWRRLEDVASSRWNLFEALSSLLINFLMTIVGVLMRSVTIIAGLAILFLAALFEIVLFIVWLFAPAIIAFLLYLGVSLLLQ